MAIGTPTSVATKDTNSSATSFATTSWTPTAGNLYVAWVGNDGAASTISTFTGNSLTWTSIATITNGAADRRLTVLAAEGTGGTAGATTAAFAVSQNACNIQILEVSGVDTSTVATSPGAGKTIVQAVTVSDSGTATSGSVTLAATLDIANRNLSGFKIKTGSTAVTPKSGWTELTEQATAGTLETQWKSTAFDTVSSGSWSNNRWCAIALELQAYLQGWGSESWGDFGWGENATGPATIFMPFLDYQAVAYTPPTVKVAQRITGMAFLDYSAVAYAPSGLIRGARPDTSLVNLRGGVRRGRVRGLGTFRASSRVRGLDNSSTVRGEYRVRGNPVRQKVAHQVTLGFINNAAVAYAPVSISSIVMPFLDYHATAHEPSVVQVRAVGRLSFLNYAATAYQISVSNVQLPFLDYTAQAYEPSVPLQLPFIDNSAVAYTPSSFDQFVVSARSITGMAFLNYAGTAYEPSNVIRGLPQQVNLPFIDNTARTFQLFIHVEIPNVIILKATYDDSITLRATYDDVIRKKVIAMGTKAPIKKLDDWNEDEDQTFLWDLPADQDATTWTTRFRLATEEGGVHILQYDGLVTASTQLQIVAPAADTSGLGGRKYFYELARIDAGHHQRIAHGEAWLGSRVS